jgi:hypothetical protein
MLGWWNDRVTRPDSVASFVPDYISSSICFHCSCLIFTTSKVCAGVRKPIVVLNQILALNKIWLRFIVGALSVHVIINEWSCFWNSGDGISSGRTLVIWCVVSYIILPSIISCELWSWHCGNIILATVLQKNIVCDNWNWIHINALEVDVVSCGVLDILAIKDHVLLNHPTALS